MLKNNYSQIRAILSVAKASLISMTKDPSAIFFSIVFPLIFIFVFGFLGGNGGSIEVAPKSGIDKENPIFKSLEENKSIKLITDKTDDESLEELSKGRIDAILDIKKNNGQTEIMVQTSSASPQNGQLFLNLMNGVSDKAALEQASIKNPPIKVSASEVSGREYKTIDFILPGQLGFALLSIGVFGTAFVFIRLRETLVLKRFFATPISKGSILLGEGLARLVFATVQATIIITIGALFLDFTLVHGLWTLLNMIILSLFGLVIFLGFGFIVSGLAKNENSVPPLANIFTMPQFLLAGTFFPIETFPTWLQPISRALPLTYVNTGLRKIAFEGMNLTQIGTELLIILLWGIGTYVVAIKIFKWD